MLLVYFAHPIWEELRSIRAIAIALRGISAVAGGMIAVSAVVLMRAAGLAPLNLAIAAATALILGFTRIPAPAIVAAALLAGALL